MYVPVTLKGARLNVATLSSALDGLASRSAGMIVGDLRTAGDAPAKEVTEPVFQDQLSARLAELSGVSLF